MDQSPFSFVFITIEDYEITDASVFFVIQLKPRFAGR